MDLSARSRVQEWIEGTGYAFDWPGNLVGGWRGLYCIECGEKCVAYESAETMRQHKKTPTLPAILSKCCNAGTYYMVFEDQGD